MSKIDEVLQEIYLEMELEEMDEILEQGELILQEATGAGAAGIDPHIKILQGKIPQLLSKLKDATGPAKEALLKQLAAAKTQLASLKTAATGMASKVVSKGQKLATKGQELVAGASSGQKMAVAGAAVAVAAVAAGVVMYKKFFSQAAKACKGKKGPDKKNCVTSFKVKGLQAAKAKVAAGMAKCKDAKCKAKLQSKVQGFDAKINSMKGSVAESTINQYVGDYVSELFLENLSKN